MLEHRLEATIPLCWSTGWRRCPLLLQHKLELACPAAGSTREGGCCHQCCWIGGGGQQLLLHSIPQICHSPCLPHTSSLCLALYFSHASSMIVSRQNLLLFSPSSHLSPQVISCDSDAKATILRRHTQKVDKIHMSDESLGIASP